MGKGGREGKVGMGRGRGASERDIEACNADKCVPAALTIATPTGRQGKVLI